MHALLLAAALMLTPAQTKAPLSISVGDGPLLYDVTGQPTVFGVASSEFVPWAFRTTDFYPGNVVAWSADLMWFEDAAPPGVAPFGVAYTWAGTGATMDTLRDGSGTIVGSTFDGIIPEVDTTGYLEYSLLVTVSGWGPNPGQYWNRQYQVGWFGCAITGP